MSIRGVYLALAQGGRVYKCPECHWGEQTVEVKGDNEGPQMMWCLRCQKWVQKPTSTEP